MKLDEFKKLVKVINNDEAENIRSQYICRFIDVSKEYYSKYIDNLKEYEDGYCYTGYLWDCLIESQVVDLEYLHKWTDDLDEVFVFWDIHTKERIFIKDYWKFEKSSVLKLKYSVLINNLEHLPEDIYIFDDSYNWSLVLTHEEFDNKRWCLKSGNLTANSNKI